MPKTHINPEGLFPSLQYGFSQVVVGEGRKTVYLSGQVAWDAKEGIGQATDLGAQARRVLENVEIGMKAAGATRKDIVSLRIYVVGEHIHNGLPIQEALLGFFPPDHSPTTTWIGVTALASKDFLIEIEAIAVLD